MSAARGTVETEDLLKVLPVVIVAFVSLGLLDEARGVPLAPFKPFLGLGVLAFAVLWLVDAR